ncbi:MAG: pyridoxal phosphate-dependent aminotransferase [Candidatus Acidiferrales bacterium]|jgi:alanine-synthesizing transaminase
MFSDRTNWNLQANPLSDALARHRAAKKPLLDLTASNPTQCGFAYNGTSILGALGNPSVLTYEPDPRGLIEARRAVAKYYADRGTDVRINDIILTTSTSEAYTFVLRTLCNPGDEILIPQPSYPLFELLAEIQDVALIRYPLVYDHGWQIDFHTLESAITPRTRAIIVVHPNNPTGHYVKADEVAQLNEVCSERGLVLISDEVFLDFNLANEAPASLAANDAAQTFTTSGISKICGLPQMKAAWLIASGPQELETEALARLEVVADTYLSMNAPIQAALPAFLDQRHDIQSQIMRRVTNNLEQLDTQLAAHKSCSRLALEGGWYAILRAPATRSDEEVAIDLLTTQNVYVHPGHFYDFESDGYLIVSLIATPGDFAEGIKRLLSNF